jgi:hypothetical protein
MVTVTDHGRWRPRLLDLHSPHGHVLQLIRALTDHVDITTNLIACCSRISTLPWPSQLRRLCIDP